MNTNIHLTVDCEGCEATSHLCEYGHRSHVEASLCCDSGIASVPVPAWYDRKRLVDVLTQRGMIVSDGSGDG
uniref:HMA domain-containing protein n=1 Tax=Steinernema glaseri TaxID=37863 RepID=A0A1I7YPF5_9BILA